MAAAALVDGLSANADTCTSLAAIFAGTFVDRGPPARTPTWLATSVMECHRAGPSSFDGADVSVVPDNSKPLRFDAGQTGFKKSAVAVWRPPICLPG